jgi:hypothetical protein
MCWFSESRPAASHRMTADEKEIERLKGLLAERDEAIEQLKREKKELKR